MTDVSNFASATTRFIGASPNPADGQVVIFGAGYDGTASFRPGTRSGPASIRTASDGIETYCPWLDQDLEDRRYSDVGDAEIGFGSPGPQIDSVYAAAKEILDAGKIPFMLGGEHSLTGGTYRAVAERHPGAVMLQLDAHADLRDHYLGEPLSHACVMRRCVEMGARLIQSGIRSGPREEWAWIRANDTLFAPEDLGDALAATGDLAIYLTLDIDVFDPSLVPGTGTPEPGGWFWPDFQRALTAIGPHASRIVALDVMEVSPGLDPGGVSQVVGAKCVRELLLLTTQQ